MCLELYSDTKKLIAEEDIECYKILYKEDGIFRTFYRDFPIEAGKTYESIISKEGYRIQMGLHSYVDKENAICSNLYTAKCIIPKGSEYYLGSFCGKDSYASNVLKYVEITEVGEA